MVRRDEGYFSAKDGTRLYFRSALPEGTPAAVIAVVHGLGDHSGRYLHVIEALAGRGFAVIAMDYRGHGRAEGRRADCRAWSDFVDDQQSLWSKALMLAPGRPAFALGHSHGGLILTHWAARHPEGLKGLVLSAPYYALAFAPPPLKLLGARIARRLTPGLAVPTGLTPQQLSSDPEWQRFTAEDPLYLRTITPRLFFEIQEAQARLEALAPALVAPLMLAVGDADPVASMPTSRRLFDQVASQDKTWKQYAGMLHEILNERGREEVLGDIAQWISSHC